MPDVKLCIDPRGPWPVELPPQPFNVVVKALGLRSLGQSMALTALRERGQYTLTMDGCEYLMLPST